FGIPARSIRCASGGRSQCYRQNRDKAQNAHAFPRETGGTNLKHAVGNVDSPDDLCRAANGPKKDSHFSETIMRILRTSGRTSVPWKNGGGTTSEVAVFPQGASFEDFGWRISIADIARSGPFSQFPGIDRTLAMLKGQVSLSIAGRDTIALSIDMPPVEFPGDVATAAELIGEAATDLNVMTRRGVFTAR